LGKSNVSSLLTSLDDLFTTQEERDAEKRETVVDIPLSEISDFPKHPFKVKMDEAMAEMADSIRRYGVLVPGMVRPKPDGGYEMIAGHRRKMASELAQKETMPCLVRDLSDDEAIIIMVDSNLQRETLLPSEKAFAYKMKLEAMKRQAGRPSKENLRPLGTDYLGQRSDQMLAQESQDSARQIQRYIRLTSLIPPLLDMVDEGRIAMRPAVELSYLAEKEQTMLREMMELEDCTPSHAQAIKMRRFAEEGKLSEEVILSIMQEEKPNQKEQFRMPRERISKYFPAGTPAQKIEETIIKALELYQRQRNRDRER
jgi:ParB family chromosome partitioning protein